MDVPAPFAGVGARAARQGRRPGLAGHAADDASSRQTATAPVSRRHGLGDRLRAASPVEAAAPEAVASALAGRAVATAEPAPAMARRQRRRTGLREPVGAPARPRARRRSRRGERQRPQGTDHARGRRGGSVQGARLRLRRPGLGWAWTCRRGRRSTSRSSARWSASRARGSSGSRPPTWPATG